jgi:hypothetical protein
VFSDSLAGVLAQFLPRQPATELEAVRYLRAFLDAHEIPLSGIEDLRILLETARVFIKPDVQAALDNELLPFQEDAGYLAALDAATDAWEHNFVRQRGRPRANHVKLAPKDNKEHREFLRPLTRVLVAGFPHVRFFFVKTGLTLVVENKPVLYFEELETDGEIISGLCSFPHGVKDDTIRELIPADFLARKTLTQSRTNNKRGICPVSMQEFIHVLQTYSVGINV